VGAREQHQSALIAKLKELRDAVPHDRDTCDEEDCDEVLHRDCGHTSITCVRCKLDAIIKETENETGR